MACLPCKSHPTRTLSLSHIRILSSSPPTSTHPKGPRDRPSTWTPSCLAPPSEFSPIYPLGSLPVDLPLLNLPVPAQPAPFNGTLHPSSCPDAADPRGRSPGSRHSGRKSQYQCADCLRESIVQTPTAPHLTVDNTPRVRVAIRGQASPGEASRIQAPFQLMRERRY